MMVYQIRFCMIFDFKIESLNVYNEKIGRLFGSLCLSVHVWILIVSFSGGPVSWHPEIWQIVLYKIIESSIYYLLTIWPILKDCRMKFDGVVSEIRKWQIVFTSHNHETLSNRGNLIEQMEPYQTDETLSNRWNLVKQIKPYQIDETYQTDETLSNRRNLIKQVKPYPCTMILWHHLQRF